MMIVLFKKSVYLSKSTIIIIGIELCNIDGNGDSSIDFQEIMHIKVNEQIFKLKGYYEVQKFLRIMDDVEAAESDIFSNAYGRDIYVTKSNDIYNLNHVRGSLKIELEQEAIGHFNNIRGVLNDYRSAYNERTTDIFFHICAERHGLDLLHNSAFCIGAEDDHFLKELMREIIFNAYHIYEDYVKKKLW